MTRGARLHGILPYRYIKQLIKVAIITKFPVDDKRTQFEICLTLCHKAIKKNNLYARQNPGSLSGT